MTIRPRFHTDTFGGSGRRGAPVSDGVAGVGEEARAAEEAEREAEARRAAEIERAKMRAESHRMLRVAGGALLSRLEATVQREREAQAEQLVVLADIVADMGALDEGPARFIPTNPEAKMAFRGMRAEVALLLGVSERTAENHLHHAYELSRNYRETLQSFREGRISYRHTTIIADVGRILGDGDDPDTVARRVAYEAQVLPLAEEGTPNRLQPAAKVIAERFASVPLDVRHEEARRRRNVCVIPQPEGMADLIAHLPAVEAYAIADRLTRVAKANKQAQEAAARAEAEAEAAAPARARTEGNARDISRCMDEYRADAMIDLLLTSVPGEGELVGLGIGAIRAQVQVVVPSRKLAPRNVADGSTGHAPGETSADISVDAETGDTNGIHCLGEDDWGSAKYFDQGIPPILPGYGPVDTATAETLAGWAPGWDRVHTDFDTGEVLRVDRYRPSEAMRRHLAARDLHCRFPGCRAPVSRCDLDHTIDAQYGGETSETNLATTCRGHHMVKHHTAWKVKQEPGGILDWESPSGRNYRDKPQSRVMFVQVPDEPSDVFPVRDRNLADRGAPPF